MEQSLNPIPTIEKTIFYLRSAFWQKHVDDVKLTGWCGYEAWMRLMRNMSLMTLSAAGQSKDRTSVTLWGCVFDKDGGQPVDEISIQADGAPVRRINTRTMEVQEILGTPGVLASEIKALQSLFRGDHAISVEYPYGELIHLLPTEASNEPVFLVTKNWDMQSFIDKGLVFKDGKRTYSLTLAGRNSIAQFNAFPT